jgi:hypothetical protein
MGGGGHVARIGEKKNMYVIGRKARGKETSKKTKTQVDGSWRGGMGWCGLDWSG